MDSKISSVTSSGSQTDNMLCPVCLLQFDDSTRAPRLLGECGHSLCHECLDELINKRLGANFECPECKCKYSLSKKAVEYIKNFTVIKWMKSCLPSSSAPVASKPQNAEEFQIFIQPLTGRKFPIAVHPSQSIADVKKTITRRLGMPIEKQRLIYCGKGLKDELKVADYKIKDGHSVQTVYRLKGGHGFNRSKKCLAL